MEDLKMPNIVDMGDYIIIHQTNADGNEESIILTIPQADGLSDYIRKIIGD